MFSSVPISKLAHLLLINSKVAGCFNFGLIGQRLMDNGFSSPSSFILFYAALVYQQ